MTLSTSDRDIIEKLTDIVDGRAKTERVSTYINNPLVWFLAVGGLIAFIYTNDQSIQNRRMDGYQVAIERLQNSQNEGQLIMRELQGNQKTLIREVSELSKSIAEIKANRYTVTDAMVNSDQRDAEILSIREWMRSLENDLEKLQRSAYERD